MGADDYKPGCEMNVGVYVNTAFEKHGVTVELGESMSIADRRRAVADKLREAARYVEHGDMDDALAPYGPKAQVDRVIHSPIELLKKWENEKPGKRNWMMSRSNDPKFWMVSLHDVDVDGPEPDATRVHRGTSELDAVSVALKWWKEKEGSGSAV